MSCYIESQIAEVALEIIKENEGIRTSELIQKCRERMQPDGEDLEIANTRNDDKFSQKVRNLKSHDTLERKEKLVVTIGKKNRQWYTKEYYDSICKKDKT